MRSTPNWNMCLLSESRTIYRVWRKYRSFLVLLKSRHVFLCFCLLLESKSSSLYCYFDFRIFFCIYLILPEDS